jgi:hypothetical protein
LTVSSQNNDLPQSTFFIFPMVRSCTGFPGFTLLVTPSYRPKLGGMFFFLAGGAAYYSVHVTSFFWIWVEEARLYTRLLIAHHHTPPHTN